jgi:PKHD-type hydroxylase
MSRKYRFRAGLELKTNNFLDEYIIVKNVFSAIECEKIINLKGKKDHSYIGTESGQVLNFNSRRSTTNFININKHMTWVLDRLANVVTEANKNVFKFNVSVLNDFNILEYKAAGFVASHFDLGREDLSFRKLSLVTFLSDPDEYKGGKLFFNHRESDFTQERGAVIIFPSYLYHQVETVSSGVRYTLVAWACGNPFR